MLGHYSLFQCLVKKASMLKKDHFHYWMTIYLSVRFYCITVFLSWLICLGCAVSHTLKSRWEPWSSAVGRPSQGWSWRVEPVCCSGTCHSASTDTPKVGNRDIYLKAQSNSNSDLIANKGGAPIQANKTQDWCGFQFKKWIHMSTQTDSTLSL